jgi:hypothetical protein
MKQLFKLFLLVSILLYVPVSSKAQDKRIFSAGLSNDYGFGKDFNNFATTFKLNYYLFDNFRVAPSFSYYLDKNDMKMRAFSFNFNYLIPGFLSNAFPTADQRVVFYPIAGFCIANIAARRTVCEECTRGSSSSNYLYYFGFDFGAGIDYDLPTLLPVLKDMTANFEVQYQIVENFSRPQFLLGIIYNF